MKARKGRKVESGTSNLPGVIKGKVVYPNPKHPDWLSYFALPKEHQIRLLQTEDKINPDPFIPIRELFIKKGQEARLAQAESGSVLSSHPVIEDIRDEKKYTIGQSSQTIDYQSGLELIHQYNRRSSLLFPRYVLQKARPLLVNH